MACKEPIPAHMSLSLSVVCDSFLSFGWSQHSYSCHTPSVDLCKLLWLHVYAGFHPVGGGGGGTGGKLPPEILTLINCTKIIEH